MTVHRITGLGLVAALTCALALSFASPALAADDLPGIPIAQLPTKGNTAPEYWDAAQKKGGWDDNFVGVSQTSKGSPDGHECGTMPGAWFLGEPTWNGMTGNNMSLTIGGEMRQLTESCKDTNNKIPGHALNVVNVVGDVVTTCYTVDGIKNYQQHSSGPGAGGYGQYSYPEGYPRSSDPKMDQVPTMASMTEQSSGGYSVGSDRAPCSRLISIKTNACGYFNGKATMDCRSKTWTWDKWKAGAEYKSGTDAGGKEGWEAAICAADPRAVECVDYVEVDGTDFDAVCKNAPVWSWTNGDTVGATIGHYAKCLFYPQNGFDDKGVIQKAWAESSAGSVQDAMVRVGSTFKFSQSCGTVLNSQGTMIPMTINTCSWEPWTVARTMLSVAAWLAFGWWAVNFCVRVVTGFVNGNTPSPVAEDGDGK